MTKFSGKGRSRLLLSVGTAMAVSLIATGAQAAESNVTPNVAPATPTPTGITNNAHDVITTVQEKLDTTNASIADSLGGVNTMNDITTDDPVDPSAVTVATNSKTSNATANTFTSSIDLAAVPGSGVDDELGGGDGASAQGVQMNLGPVNSTVSDNEIHALLQNFSTGSVTVNNNTIQANGTGNSGSTTLAGVILPEYASDAPGYSALNFGTDADWLDSTGSLLASTVQIQSNDAGGISNTATADGNSVLLTLQNTVDDASVNASPKLDTNTIAATVAGNSSNSTIDVKGGASAFVGTAVISNGQVNVAQGDGDDDFGDSIVATNDGSTILATVAADGDLTSDDAELHGALSVTGNAITSNASGNQALGATKGEAGNRIQLADGMSFQGSGDEENTPGADVTYDAGTLGTTAAGDLVIHNSQGNVGAANSNRLAITGSTHNGEIAAVVNDISGGSVAVSDNQITGTASGNAASSVFASGANLASFAGSATVASQQTNYYTNILAEGTGDIYANVTDTDENELPKSTVSVDGNVVAADAYGNSVSQSLSLDAAVQNLPLSAVSLTAGTGPDGNVSSEGSATVTNAQTDYSSNVGAREVHNIYATAGAESVDSSSVGVTNSTGEAFALGNSGSNALSLSGESVGAGAGIVSLQTVDGAGSAGDAAAVSASSTGIVQVNTNDDVDSSNLELSGNLQLGVAYGNSVSNTLNVEGQGVTVDGSVNQVASTVTYFEDTDHGLNLDHDAAPSVNAAYGTLNDQSLNGNVTAEALPAYWTDLGASFAVTTGDDVSGSGIVNDSNALVANAYGNNATNVSGLNVGNLDTSNENFASVINTTNVQTVTQASNVSAHAGGSSAVLTAVDDDVDNSTISTSSNTVQALAYGNLASSHQTVTGTNIDTEADSFPLGTRGRSTASGLTGGETQTDASFSVNNVQYAGGSIGSSLVTDGDPGTSAAIATTIGDDVTDSTITSNGNTLSSGATGNRADNLSDLSGNGLATTNALANMQFVGGAQITSSIGTPGGIQEVQTSPGTPDTLFGYDYMTHYVLDGECADGACPVGSAYDAINLNTDDLSEAEIDYLVTNDGWTFNAGPNTLTRSVTGVTSIDQENINGVPGSTSDINLGDGTDPTYDDVYVAGHGGVTIAIGGNIDPSTVSVNGNTVSGSVTGNSATNAVSTTGTAVADGSDHLATWAIVDSGARDATALGDHMLSNVQVVDVDTNLTSNVDNVFGIDTTEGADIANSTLTVDGNSQSSRAVANTADNSVTLNATNTAAGASLVSFQDGRASVEANSEADIHTPVASEGSSISMSDNSNLAVAVMNNTTNTLTVDTNSATYVTFANQAVGLIDATDDDLNSMVLGDHVLLNQQRATDDGAVTANAATSVQNNNLADFEDLDNAGIVNGTVTVTGNNTTAEASANRAVNTANVTAGSSLSASTAVANVQTSAAVVTSSATTLAGVGLSGDEEGSPALNASSVTVGGNTTTALARGNAAANALNYSAGANYGAGTGNGAATAAGLDGAGGAVTAQAMVLNAQVNTGAVSASSTDATYGIALNGVDGSPIATNGTMGVIGNSVSAAAYGNTASNSLTLTSLNTGMPTAAIGNYQTNSGAVTASVTTVNYGVTSGFGAVAGSALAVTGNAVTATAVGNSAVSIIAAAH